MQQATTGQSLAEFAIGFSVLAFLMIAGTYIGMGMYHGQMASDAIREPIFQRNYMAKTAGAITPIELLTMIRMTDTQGNIRDGNQVDNINVVTSNNTQTAIIVGAKTFNNPFVPLTFTVTQGIHKNLLAANTGGSESATVLPPISTPPWEAAPEVQQLLSGVDCNSGSTLGEPHAESMANGSGTYLSRASFSATAPMPERNVMELSRNHMGECANEGAGTCQAEYDDFLPEEIANTVYRSGDTARGYFSHKNPPGMPGYQVFFRYVMDADDTRPERDTGYDDDPVEPIMEIVNNPEHGFYIDPSGEYRQPPAEMVPDCMKRKQAECAIKKGAERAGEICQQFARHTQGI